MPTILRELGITLTNPVDGKAHELGTPREGRSGPGLPSRRPGAAARTKGAEDLARLVR